MANQGGVRTSFLSWGPLLKDVAVRLPRLLCKSKTLLFPVDFINLGWAYWIFKIMDFNYFARFSELGKSSFALG